MNIPKPGDTVYIHLTDGNTINASIVEWGTNLWGHTWVVYKEGDKVFTLNIAQISVFSIVRSSPDQYKLVPKEGNPRVINAQTTEPERYFIKAGKKEDSKVVVTRRILKQGKAVVDEGINQDNLDLSTDPVERAQQLLVEADNTGKSVRKSVKDLLNRTDLEKPKDVYALPSFKNRSKK